MNNIQEQRESHTLTVKMRYEEGVMTRKEWIELKHSQGWYSNEGTRNRIQFNRTKFNRMSSYKEQEEYEKKCEEKILQYELRHHDINSIFDITKAEFNYFNTLIR